MITTELHFMCFYYSSFSLCLLTIQLHVRIIFCPSRLLSVVEALFSVKAFNYAKFSVLLVLSFLINHNADPKRRLVDDTEWNAAKSLLPRFIEFVQTNDSGRSHGWGWDGAEATRLYRLFSSDLVEIRLFLLWSVALGLKEKERLGEIMDALDRSGLRSFAVSMLNSSNIMERSISCAIFMRLSDVPSIRLVDDDISDLQKATDSMDIVIEADGGSIHAHGLIISARSSFFRREIGEARGKELEAGAKDDVSMLPRVLRLKLHHIPVNVVRVVVDFCYNDFVKISSRDEAMLVIPWLEHFNLPNIREICEEAIIGSISLENLLETVEFAKSNACSLLLDRCWRFVAANVSEIIGGEIYSLEDLCGIFDQKLVQNAIQSAEDEEKMVEEGISCPFDMPDEEPNVLWGGILGAVLAALGGDADAFVEEVEAAMDIEEIEEEEEDDDDAEDDDEEDEDDDELDTTVGTSSVGEGEMDGQEENGMNENSMNDNGGNEKGFGQ
eukprot:TRINITY_DN1169_c1_g2_i1.p2 TRINITY_DN1169_c1_g2~~TRINITY_DN1169_c1_g2_i1.p2  ORF type:complete len:498 (+),score=163.73 TRINITY_DN1169_c1_g2_i1:1030-2523(+)